MNMKALVFLVSATPALVSAVPPEQMVADSCHVSFAGYDEHKVGGYMTTVDNVKRIDKGKGQHAVLILNSYVELGLQPITLNESYDDAISDLLLAEKRCNGV